MLELRDVMYRTRDGEHWFVVPGDPPFVIFVCMACFADEQVFAERLTPDTKVTIVINRRTTRWVDCIWVLDKVNGVTPFSSDGQGIFLMLNGEQETRKLQRLWDAAHRAEPTPA